jgi:hypothetical protein
MYYPIILAINVFHAILHTTANIYARVPLKQALHLHVSLFIKILLIIKALIIKQPMYYSMPKIVW